MRFLPCLRRRRRVSRRSRPLVYDPELAAARRTVAAARTRLAADEARTDEVRRLADQFRRLRDQNEFSKMIDRALRGGDR